MTIHYVFYSKLSLSAVTRVKLKHNGNHSLSVKFVSEDSPLCFKCYNVVSRLCSLMASIFVSKDD